MKNLLLVVLIWIGTLSYWGYRFLATNWEKIVALMTIPETMAVKVTESWTVWPFVWPRGWDALIFLAILLLIVGLREWIEECCDASGKALPPPMNILGGPTTGLLIGFLWGLIQDPKEPIGMILLIVGLFGLALLNFAVATRYRYSPWSALAYLPGVGLGYGVVHGLVAGLVVIGLLLGLVAGLTGPCLAAAGIYLHRTRRAVPMATVTVPPATTPVAP